MPKTAVPPTLKLTVSELPPATLRVNVYTRVATPSSATAAGATAIVTAGGLIVPVIAKWKGFSLESFVGNEISPLLIPTVALSNCTVNVSDAPASRLPVRPSVSAKPDGTVTELYESRGAFSMIISIAVGPGGTIWLGDLGEGIHYFDGSAWQQLTTADGLPTNGYHEGSVVVDPQGAAWFAGTDGGLARYVP